MTDDTSWTEVFTSVFDAPSSPIHARIWAEVYGDDYPAELEPYSFTTRSELRRVVAELGLAPGDLLVDVGCGRGGPGLWVASTAGASLLGVDISPTALDAARARAAALGLGDSATYAEGSYESIPLEAGSARGVLGICLLYTSPSPRDGLLSRMPSSA